MSDLLALTDKYGIEVVVFIGALLALRRYGPIMVARLLSRYDMRERHDLEQRASYQRKTENLYERLIATTEPTLTALNANTVAINEMSAMLEQTVKSLDEQIPAILKTLERLGQQLELTNSRINRLDDRVVELEDQTCEDVKL